MFCYLWFLLLASICQAKYSTRKTLQQPFYLFLLFSIVKNGIGWIICSIGILIFLLKIQLNLRSIDEQTQTRNSNTIKFISVCFGCISFITTAVLLSYINTEKNFYYQHLRTLLNNVILFICIPKYFINQNENCKLYVSVYDHHPPPVLPWQLPTNFDPNSVKLKVVQLKKWIKYLYLKIHFVELDCLTWFFTIQVQINRSVRRGW